LNDRNLSLTQGARRASGLPGWYPVRAWWHPRRRRRVGRPWWHRRGWGVGGWRPGTPRPVEAWGCDLGGSHPAFVDESAGGSVAMPAGPARGRLGPLTVETTGAWLRLRGALQHSGCQGRTPWPIV